MAVLMAALWAGPAAAQSPDQAKAEWDRIVAAAEKEGSVVLNSQPNLVWRDFILREFAKAYPKIELNFSIIPSEQFVARVRVERQTGKYLWDLAAAGAAAGLRALQGRGHRSAAARIDLARGQGSCRLGRLG